MYYIEGTCSVYSETKRREEKKTVHFDYMLNFILELL